MRVIVFAIASTIALAFAPAAFADTAMADDPKPTPSAVTAAPEPMAQSETAPQSEHTDTQGLAQPASTGSADDKIICHHPVHDGTILPHQVCLTKHAWELIRLREQKNVEDSQRRER
jgi:hypothetical protein